MSGSPSVSLKDGIRGTNVRVVATVGATGWMSVGALIRELRLTLGWSQGRLASALCEASQHATVTREDVSRWEHGKRKPGPFWMRHLATVLQVPLHTLERADV